MPVPLAGTVYVWLPPGSQVTLPALSLAMNLYSTAVLAGRVTVFVQIGAGGGQRDGVGGGPASPAPATRADQVDRLPVGAPVTVKVMPTAASAVDVDGVGDGVPPVTRALTWIATASLALAPTVAWPEPLTVTVGPLQVPERR